MQVGIDVPDMHRIIFFPYLTTPNARNGYLSAMTESGKVAGKINGICSTIVDIRIYVL